jgi:hypothetical protein
LHGLTRAIFDWGTVARVLSCASSIPVTAMMPSVNDLLGYFSDVIIRTIFDDSDDPIGYFSNIIGWVAFHHAWTGIIWMEDATTKLSRLSYLSRNDTSVVEFPL